MENLVLKALDYFKKNPLLYAPIAEIISENKGEVIRCDKRGVLIKEGENRYAAAFTCRDTVLEYKHLSEEGLFIIYDAGDMDFYTKNFAGNFQVPCTQIVYTLKTPPPPLDVAEFRLLDESYADIINQKYTRSRGNPEYYRVLLEKKYMWGAFIDGTLAGFAGRHDDGAMGLLEVFPEFKRRGIGMGLAHLIIDKVLAEGRIPYGHVVFGNDISMNLQKQIEGMAILPETVLFLRSKSASK